MPQAEVLQETPKGEWNNSVVVLLEKVLGRLDHNNKKTMETMQKEMTKVVSDALGEVPTRYIDVGRIPLICKAIFEIQLQMKLLLWVVAISGSAIVVGVIGLIFKR